MQENARRDSEKIAMKESLGEKLLRYWLVPTSRVLASIGLYLAGLVVVLPLLIAPAPMKWFAWGLAIVLTVSALLIIPRLFNPMSITAHEDGLKIEYLTRRAQIIPWSSIVSVTGDLFTVDMPDAGDSTAETAPDRRTVLLPPYYLALQDGSRIAIKGHVRMLPLGMLLVERTLPHLIPATLDRLGAGEWITVHPRVKYSGQGVRVGPPQAEPESASPRDILWRDLQAVKPEPGGIRILVKDQRDIILSSTVVSNFAVFVAVTALIKQKITAPPDMFSQN